MLMVSADKKTTTPLYLGNRVQDNWYPTNPRLQNCMSYEY